MGYYQAEASGTIDAPPDQVYAIISDYHKGHPTILPTRYFTRMTVDEGGVGDGTVTTVLMNVFGTRATFQLHVTEPEPGRVLVEEDRSTGDVTTFTLDPDNGSGGTRVTISTKAKTGPGLRGVVEGLVNPSITRKIYREELQQLAEVVQRERTR